MVAFLARDGYNLTQTYILRAINQSSSTKEPSMKKIMFAVLAGMFAMTFSAIPTVSFADEKTKTETKSETKTDAFGDTTIEKKSETTTKSGDRKTKTKTETKHEDGKTESKTTIEHK